MKFATESCITMEKCIRAGMPVLLLSAGQAGATAPAPLATAIVQAVAECLAGVVYVNAMAPGHPAVFGTWPFVSDLRTGRNVGRLGRTGAALGGLRADAPVLRSAGRRGGGHCRFQAARHAGRLGAGISNTSWPG
jgi:trimethylamine--corrinoid protein Co-methyltransferase